MSAGRILVTRVIDGLEVMFHIDKQGIEDVEEDEEEEGGNEEGEDEDEGNQDALIMLYQPRTNFFSMVLTKSNIDVTCTTPSNIVQVANYHLLDCGVNPMNCETANQNGTTEE